MRPHDARRFWVLLALAGTLSVAVPGLLAVEAWQAGERHRRAAERALRTHAEFAATEFRQRLVGLLYPAVLAIFAPLGSARLPLPDRPLPGPGVLEASAREAAACQTCGPALRPAWYFRLTWPDTAVAMAGTPPPHARSWVPAALAYLGDPGDNRTWEQASLMDTLGPTPSVVVVTLRRGRDGRPRALYGMAVPLQDLVTSVVHPALDRLRLLPIPEHSAPPNDSVVAIEFTAPEGRPSLPVLPARRPSPYASTIPGGLYLGGWQIRLALDPRHAPPLLIGELPRSRTPLLVALVLLTAGLAISMLVFAYRAHALAQARAAFVAGVSHELRTPLAQILLFSETLSLGRMHSPADSRNAAGIIASEARRLIQLVERVLAFGRRPLGAEVVARHEPIRLDALIGEVADGFAPLAARAGVSIRREVPRDLTVRGDPDGLRQVVLNLLDNAVKYGPEGQTVTVAAGCRNGRIRIAVEDQGPGIPEPDRRRVWEPFVRLARDEAAGTTGSGLGLAVVREVVERQGGSVAVEAAAAGGARVVVELPAGPGRDGVPCGS